MANGSADCALRMERPSSWSTLARTFLPHLSTAPPPAPRPSPSPQARGGGGGGGGGKEKLDPRVVKGMKPAELKDALKERGLSIQGSKKVNAHRRDGW